LSIRTHMSHDQILSTAAGSGLFVATEGGEEGGGLFCGEDVLPGDMIGWNAQSIMRAAPDGRSPSEDKNRCYDGQKYFRQKQITH